MSLLEPLQAFIVTLALIYILLVLKRDPIKVLLLAAAAFGLLSLGPVDLARSTSLGIISYRTLSVLLAFLLAFFLAGLLREVGILESITRAFAKKGCDVAALGVPALVGLVPMSGGALVSAMMLKRTFFEEMAMGKAEATFTNYWFRHVWVPTWPLYQSMIIAAAVLDTRVSRIISITYPGTLTAITAGVIVYLATVGRRAEGRCGGEGGSLVAIWPFLLLAILVVGTGMSVWIALLMTVIVSLAVYRPEGRKILEAAKFALSPKLLAIVVGSMLFASYIESSGAAASLYKAAVEFGIPGLLVAFMLTFSVGIVSSGEFVFSAVALPMLTGIIGEGSGIKALPLLVAYMGGHMGTMLSPLHLCMILTLHYYEADYASVFPRVLLAVALTLVLLVPAAFLLQSG